MCLQFQPALNQGSPFFSPTPLYLRRMKPLWPIVMRLSPVFLLSCHVLSTGDHSEVAPVLGPWRSPVPSHPALPAPSRPQASFSIAFGLGSRTGQPASNRRRRTPLGHELGHELTRERPEETVQLLRSLAHYQQGAIFNRNLQPRLFSILFRSCEQQSFCCYQ